MSLFHAGVGPALDTNANPISGARWQFTRTGGTTPVAVYADSGLATSLGSYVSADSAGRFVDIYLDDAVIYRARLWPDATMTGTPIKDIDPVNGPDGSVDLSGFGATGDGLTDDTAAVQDFVDYITDNHLIGYAPAGTYLLTDTIDFPETYGWGIIGAGEDATIFKMATDNVPIFKLGASAVDSMHGYVLAHLNFTYSNVQAAANTAANCILFSAEGHQGNLYNIRFMRGFYGIKITSGIPSPWGQKWANLRFHGELTGGAILSTGSLLGTPNNEWGRMVVMADNMTDTIFKDLKGYNWTITTIEILSATNLQLFRFQAGSSVDIGSIKLETATYTGTVTDNFLINAQVNTSIRIGCLSVGGTVCVLTPSTTTYLFGGQGGRIEVGHLIAGASTATSNFYVCGGTNDTQIRRHDCFVGSALPLTNVAGAVTANSITVLPDKNDRLSDDKGDAAYTITQGDPGTIIFETTLTASRTVALPVDATKLFNGLRYRIISNGAVNGANTLVIAASGNTKATLRGPYEYVDLEWRRNTTAHSGWKVVGTGSTRPGALAVVATADLPAAAAAMDGTVLIEDAGAGDRNLIVYAGAQRFRIDGGANV